MLWSNQKSCGVLGKQVILYLGSPLLLLACSWVICVNYSTSSASLLRFLASYHILYFQCCSLDSCFYSVARLLNQADKCFEKLEKSILVPRPLPGFILQLWRKQLWDKIWEWPELGTSLRFLKMHELHIPIRNQRSLLRNSNVVQMAFNPSVWWQNSNATKSAIPSLFLNFQFLLHSIITHSPLNSAGIYIYLIALS